MTISKGITTILGCGVGGTLLGGGLGYSIGCVAPDAYRAMFHVPSDVPISPADVGLGLGLAQGLVLGVVVGVVLVAVVAWYDVRMAALRSPHT